MASTSSETLPKLPNGLPNPTTFLTTHDQQTGKSIVHSSRPSDFKGYDEAQYTMAVSYTTSEFPPSLNDDKDIKAHEKLMASKTLGLNHNSGTVCRHVDFAPGYQCMMHRTQSLDYGIVVEGEIEMVLDSGEIQLMRRGDIAVQRATMHAWRNPSKTEWSRMVFVLQDCEKVVVKGKALGDEYDLPPGTEA